MLLAVAGAILAHNRIPIQLRKSHTVPLGLINGGLTVTFGVIVGFSAFLVLNKYQAAEQRVQSEAADVEEVYRYAQELPEPRSVIRSKGSPSPMPGRWWRRNGP